MNNQNPQAKIFIKAAIIAGFSLILGFAFDYLFFEKVPGLGFPLYIMLIMGGLFTISAYFRRQLGKEVLWLLVPLGFFSLMVFVRASELLTFLNIVACILLLIFIAKLSFGGGIKNFFIFDYIKILFLPFKFIVPLASTALDLFALRILGREQKTLSQVIKGIILTIPVLVIFLFLFASADLIFQKYLTEFVNIDIEEETIVRSIFVLIVTLIFTGAYSYVFRTPSEDVTSSTGRVQSVGHIEASILLGSINILFFIFMLVQIAYLFGGEANISSQGFTFAEYARRGFFELIVVAVISFLLLWGTEKYIVKKDIGHSVLFKVLSSALIVQVMLIMGSAFKRLLLYEEAYGFTTDRFYSHSFIILLVVIFCLLVYKIYKDNRENALAFRIFISIVLFLGVLNILNPDVFVARRNIERFQTTGKLDLYYLNQLSDDAIPTTVQILDSANEDLRKNFARELYSRITATDSSFSSQWQSLNISRMNAEKIFESRIEELEQYKDYPPQNFDSAISSP